MYLVVWLLGWGGSKRERKKGKPNLANLSIAQCQQVQSLWILWIRRQGFLERVDGIGLIFLLRLKIPGFTQRRTIRSKPFIERKKGKKMSEEHLFGPCESTQAQQAGANAPSVTLLRRTAHAERSWTLPRTVRQNRIKGLTLSLSWDHGSDKHSHFQGS